MEEKEKYYNAFLTGILLGNPNWGIRSQKESGYGLPDIEVRPDNLDAGIIIETKSMDKVTQLEEGCQEALKQICEKRYYDCLVEDGRYDIWAYGIAFCRVAAQKIKL